MVVLPTPPFGLKTTRIVARDVQPSVSMGPLWSTGPDPSSTVWLRMHIASTRQRRDSAEYGRREVFVLDPPAARIEPSQRPLETTISAGMARPLSRSSE